MGVSQNYQQSDSGPVTKSPFGNMPFGIAGGLRSAFARPLMRGFGYQKGKGPLATFINQAKPELASYIPSMTSLGGELAGGARSTYGGYQSAVDSFMQQLPGLQRSVSGAPEQASYARTFAEDAFSPLASRASFQEASRRALAPAREGAAARGMLEGGQGQVGEQNLLSDLAFQQLQADQAQKQAAISGLAGLDAETRARAETGANLAALGPQMRGQQQGAYGQLGQMLQTATGLPMDAMNQALSFFQGINEPSYNLLKMVLPTVATKSHSFGGGGSVGKSG